MKKIVLLLIITIHLIMSTACGNSNATQSLDIIPKSEEHKLFDNKEIELNIDTAKNEFDKLSEKYKVPAVLRNDNVRIRSHPTFLSDVIAVGESGSTVHITKRTGEKVTNLIGEEHYWFYAMYKSSTPTMTGRAGWIYGGEIFSSEYEYPYINNLEIVSLPDTSLDKRIQLQTIFKSLNIDKDAVKVKYAPNTFSSTVFTLKKGEDINIFEKTPFKQSINNGSQGRWFYIKHKHNDIIVSGWVHEYDLPKTADPTMLKKLPYNYIYRKIDTKPVYIAELHKEQNSKNALIHIISRVEENGMITDVDADYGYYTNTNTNGYIDWLVNNLSDDGLYVYKNGEKIAKVLPDTDKLNNAGNISFRSGVLSFSISFLSGENRIKHNETYIAISEDIKDKSIINIKNYENNIQSDIKNNIKNKVINELKSEAGLKYNEKKSDSIINISPIMYKDKKQYFYTADIRGYESGADTPSKTPNYVFKQIGIYSETDGYKILESFYKRINNSETANFIEKNESIIALIDFDSNGNDEVIIRQKEMNNQINYKIIMPTNEGYITLLN